VAGYANCVLIIRASIRLFMTAPKIYKAGYSLIIISKRVSPSSPHDRDRGRPLGRCPSHTTRHAGPHRAVREVEVVDGYGQSPQAFLFYVPPNELHHELNRVGIHPSLFNPPQLPELLMPCTFERHNFRLSSSFSPSLHASSCGVGRGWL